MKINKSLKFANFSYDDESKIFTITDGHGNEVELNKVYAFAFMRFVVRIAQRNWLRSATQNKKNLDKPCEDVVSLEESPENSNQLFFENFKDESPSKAETFTLPQRGHQIYNP